MMTPLHYSRDNTKLAYLEVRESECHTILLLVIDNICNRVRTGRLEKGLDMKATRKYTREGHTFQMERRKTYTEVLLVREKKTKPNRNQRPNRPESPPKTIR